MTEIIEVPIPDLLLDGGNPRLENDQAGQQEVALNLAAQQGERLVKLAEDIVESGGLDPTALIAVIAVGDAHKRYKVIEGNRRVLALKALETPSLVSPSLAPKDSRKLSKLSGEYSSNPLGDIPCVLFASEEEARHWIELRHTGQNGGAGLVDWGSDEKDRFNARHAGARSPAGQVIDFVSKHGTLSAEAKASPQKTITSLARLLSNPTVRRRIGVDLQRGEVIALHPTEVVAKALTRVVEDLKTGKVTVPDLYKAADRENYANSLPRSVTPTKKTLLDPPVSLAGLTAGETKPAPRRKQKPRRKKPSRTTLITKEANLDVTVPRVNSIYNELLTLVVDQYPNACGVLLRVFIEFSIDHFVAENKLTVGKRDSLAQRMRIVATELESSGAISTKLRKAIEQVANGPSVLAPGMSTFNQYVHNEFTHPKPRELCAAWDEIQPFMEQLWP